LTAGAILLAAPSAAQTPPVTPTPPDFPRGRISGLVFGDYYYNLAGDPDHGYTSTGSDTGKAYIDNSTAKLIGKDLNGFQIRRVYFQLDNDLSIKYSTRFRLEADSKSLTSDGKIGVALRNAYLQVKSVYPRADLFFGLIATPIWETPEDFWQYRAVEKPIADFRGLGSAQDLGAELKGFADPDHHFGYSAMVGNGLGQKPEDNRYKKFMVALPVRVGDLRFEPYVDYENVAGGLDRATYRGFAGYEFRRVAVATEVVDRVNHRPAGNQEPLGVSVFARGNASPTVAGFARVDLWRPDRRAANRVDSQLWIAGLDWQPFRDLHFMPNLEVTQFDAKGTAVAPPHHELQARVTVYYRFLRPQS